MSETSNAAKGCLGILLVMGIASCAITGGFKQMETQTVADTAPLAGTTSTNAVTEFPIDKEARAEKAKATNAPSGSMTEAQRLTLTQIDPELKQASDFLGLLINTNGHLCAQVSNVEPVGGTKYEVTCVQYRSGSGRVRYLVDGATSRATPL